MCTLDKAKGLDIGKTYHTDKYAAQFVHFISQAQIQNNLSIFETAKFATVISDGSTDSSFCEAEIVFIRFATKGQLYTQFVGVANVAKANAENITKAITNILDGVMTDSWRQKIVALATDGAAVMLDKNNGVVKRNKELVHRPSVLAIHCSAHRLELTYKHSCKDVPLFVKINAMLLSMYYFYRNSPLQRSNLKESFKANNMTCLIPSRVGGTRWIPHIKRALKNLLVGYGSIVQHLKQLQADPGEVRKDSAARAGNYLKLLLNKSALCFVHFIYDIVICLAHVSEAIQARGATLADVQSELDATRAMLLNYRDSDGTKLKLVMGKEEYKGHGLSSNMSGFQSARTKLIDSLLLDLNKRFEADAAVIRASTITNMSSWPQCKAEAKDFGNEHVSLLVDALEIYCKTQG